MPRSVVLPSARLRPGARRPRPRGLRGGRPAVPAPGRARRVRRARRAGLAAAAIGAAATAFAAGLVEGLGTATARAIADAAVRLIAARAGWAW